MTLKLTFSNPRSSATFGDWPIGGQNRGMCVFNVEHDAKRGYRFVRRTTDKAGKWCKPKTKTFGGLAVIVDGSDGKTYLLQFAGGGFEFIKISRHDFLDADAEAGVSSVFPDHPAHAELAAIIRSGQDAATMLYPT